MPFRFHAGRAGWLFLFSLLVVPTMGCGDDDAPADGSVDSSDGGASDDGSVAMDAAASDASSFDGAPSDGSALDGGGPDASLIDGGPDTMSVDASVHRDTSPPFDGGMTPDSGPPFDGGSLRDSGPPFDAGDDCRRDFTAVYEIIGDDDNPSGCWFDGSFCTARQDPFNEVEITCDPFLPFSCTLDGCQCDGFVSSTVDFNYFINFGTERLTIVVGGRICEYDFLATAVPPS